MRVYKDTVILLELYKSCPATSEVQWVGTGPFQVSN